MKITVLFPTETEASQFRRTDVDTIISGVGLTATTYSTMKAIQQGADILILAGIAGMYANTGLQLHQVVMVKSEVEADFGFSTVDGFTHMAHLPIDMEFERRHVLDCPYLSSSLPFQQVRGASVNAAMAPFINIDELDIENMEGAAFFYTCLKEGQRFLQIRSISNVVKIGDHDWDMHGSVAALTAGLHQLIDLLQSTE